VGGILFDFIELQVDLMCHD